MMIPDQKHISGGQSMLHLSIDAFHGTEPREPWEYDAFTVKVYRLLCVAAENLRPYIVKCGSRSS